VWRLAAEDCLLRGGRVVDVIGSARHSVTLARTRLADDEYAVLKEFASGSRGPGPFLLVAGDARWNYLPAARTAATSLTGDTLRLECRRRGSPRLGHRQSGVGEAGPRSLRWPPCPAHLGPVGRGPARRAVGLAGHPRCAVDVSGRRAGQPRRPPHRHRLRLCCTGWGYACAELGTQGASTATSA